MKWEHPVQMLRFTEDANDGVMTDKAHYLLLYAVTHLVKPSVAIEIGSRRGGSAIWIAKAMEEIGNGTLYCIDPFVNKYGGAEAFLHHFQENIEAVGLDHRIELIKATSLEAVDNTPGNCDLLFIDGDHSYEGCMFDIKHYATRVSTGGALVIHDSICEAPVAQAIRDSERILSGFMATEVYNRNGIWIGFKL